MKAKTKRDKNTILFAEMRIKAQIAPDQREYGEPTNLEPTKLPTIDGTDQAFIIIDPTRKTPIRR